MVIKIAITGNIASGKSQVEKFISEKGFTVYDSDKLAHDVLNTVSEFYGYDVFTNGKIDRKKLGDLVFSNPELRQKLENIIHPKIKTKIYDLFEKHKSEKYIFISVPLLYEAGFDSMFDKVIFVSIDKDIQIKRLIKRSNCSLVDAMKRINAQLPQEEKLQKADYVIDNNSSVEALEHQLKDILQTL